MESAPGFCFTSTRFTAEAGEDAATNPRLYGRQAAQWLRERFIALGYPVEEVFPEDWGWCVMCQREPYELWIGCANLPDHVFADEGDPPPPQAMLLWCAVPCADQPWLSKATVPEMRDALNKFAAELGAVLAAEPSLTRVDESVALHWFPAVPQREHGLPIWRPLAYAGIALASVCFFFPFYLALHPLLGPAWAAGLAGAMACIGLPMLLLWRSDRRRKRQMAHQRLLGREALAAELAAWRQLPRAELLCWLNSASTRSVPLDGVALTLHVCARWQDDRQQAVCILGAVHGPRPMRLARSHEVLAVPKA